MESPFSSDILFHGTTELRGHYIHLPTLKPSESSRLTHGNCFYTTGNFFAACLFSNKAVQRDYFKNSFLTPLDQIKKAEKAGIGKIYTVQATRARILNARLPLPLSKAKEILLRANVPTYMQKSFLNRELTDFYTLVHLVSFSNRLPKNPFEYITTELQYDGLRFIESCWDSWDYYPEHLGLGIDKFIASPASVIFYKTEKITSFKEIDQAIIQQHLNNGNSVNHKKEPDDDMG
jgi:hypothetical protein